MTEIETIEQIDTVLAGTEQQPILIYKHSTACPTSFSAKRRLTEFLKSASESGTALPAVYFVNVIESRKVSQAIAERLDVPHKSPQILLVDQGRCRWNTSHYEITGENIEKALHEMAA